MLKSALAYAQVEETQGELNHLMGTVENDIDEGDHEVDP